MKEDIMPGNEATEERWLHGAVEEAGHRGRGPKNYHRTDARVFEDVCEALTENDAVDASDVDVSVEKGMVSLVGTVATQRMKEMAEKLVVCVPGVRSVRNLLEAR